MAENPSGVGCAQTLGCLIFGVIGVLLAAGTLYAISWGISAGWHAGFS